jgi:hypothetical protein
MADGLSCLYRIKLVTKKTNRIKQENYNNIRCLNKVTMNCRSHTKCQNSKFPKLIHTIETEGCCEKHMKNCNANRST